MIKLTAETAGTVMFLLGVLLGYWFGYYEGRDSWSYKQWLEGTKETEEESAEEEWRKAWEEGRKR